MGDRPPRPLDEDESELVVDAMLAAAGPGRTAVYGDGAAPIATAMNLRGVDTALWGGMPDTEALHRGGAIDNLVLWHALDASAPDAAQEILERLRPFVRRALIVRMDVRERGTSSLGERWIEPLAFAARWRKHPLYLQLSPYESREGLGAEEFHIFEPLPAAAAAFPLDWLAGERDLHMDMLREAGRRADAHVERYRLALQYVRPGDTVLDVACGMGYGSHLLYAGSAAASVLGVDESEQAVRYASACFGAEGRIAFRRGDAQSLDFLEDDSVDLVVSFETLEHLHEPSRFLDEARRVLRPSGRLVACVPNQWVDETGEDPNPHHHHVYDWTRLGKEIGARFRIEQAYRQIAGGGMTHTGHGRLLREFDPATQPGPAEWLVVVAMRDPVAAPGVYVETSFPGYEDLAGFNVARFAGEYDNPWLVKGLVTIGFRFGRRGGLVEMAQAARAAATPGSPDEGAALCVEAYAALGGGSAMHAERERLAAALHAYADRAGDGPHARRWAVSNLYVAGLLQLTDRRFADARRTFERCMALDVLAFSPLLATKTIGAAWLAGLIAAIGGESDYARLHWRHGIRVAKAALGGDWTNVIGREERPLYFGLPEVALAVSKASKCAYALAAIDGLEHRPGRFWIELSRDLESQAAREGRALRHTLRELARASALGAAGQEVGNAEEIRNLLDNQAHAISEMRGASERQAARIADLQAALAERDAAIGTQGATIAGMQRSFAAQAESLARLNASLLERDAALETQAGTIARLNAAVQERDDALGKQGATIGEMHAAFAQQAENIARLNDRILEAGAELEARDVLLADSRALAAAREAEVGRLQSRLRAIESSWPYRMLRRYMDKRAP